MVTRRELGHDAAVGRVQLHLALHDVALHAAVAGHDRGARLITRSFDAEDDHVGRGVAEFAAPANRRHTEEPG
jgi:hypothetical protein